MLTYGYAAAAMIKIAGVRDGPKNLCIRRYAYSATNASAIAAAHGRHGWIILLSWSALIFSVAGEMTTLATGLKKHRKMVVVLGVVGISRK